jgi:clan AA aspartic protease (TIGR02281 family)
VILKETPLVVELEIGGGSITVNRSDVKSIKRANPKDLADFKGSLEAKQDRLKAQSNTFADERERRFKEYGDWTMDEARRRAERQQVGGDVKIVRDPMSRSILVEAVLNNGVNVTLTLDTGAAVIVLSKDVGDKLGVNMSDQTKDVRELRLAGGKTAKAKMVMLKSVDVQGIEEKDVLAAILFDDAGRIGFRDGLLGMTFLGRFSMGLDMEKMKMSLKRLR